MRCQPVQPLCLQILQRRYAIILIFVISAVITPPDVVSQILMALPMMGLYELGIIIARIFGKKK